MYLDPPYFEKGDRLYRQRMTLTDHLALAEALRTAPNWVLSYDRSPVVEALYEWADCRIIKARYSINGRKERWAANEELVIVPPRKG
jgi:DNA adenine methylase